MVKVSKDVYFIEASTNVGIINTDNEVYVIDPGTSRKAFKEIKENFEGRKIVVLNTHHHADHILLNYLYQGDFGCSIYANELEVHLINNPDFEGQPVAIHNYDNGKNTAVVSVPLVWCDPEGSGQLIRYLFDATGGIAVDDEFTQSPDMNLQLQNYPNPK